ncbi:NUDIX domain-containing protein, partial [Candidatus Saccharibacteria bacterium]|nr:NUDIX domain-containing protein [Candidatus Saccharibacteria bacterium]
LKMERQYYTLLGGRVELGETPDQTAIREVIEESTVVIANPVLVFIEDAEPPFGTQYVYLCDYVSGEPYMPEDAEEMHWTVPGKNTYEPLWVPITDLPHLDFVSPLLKEALLMAFEHGWPKEPYRFSQKHTSRLS